MCSSSQGLTGRRACPDQPSPIWHSSLLPLSPQGWVWVSTPGPRNVCYPWKSPLRTGRNISKPSPQPLCLCQTLSLVALSTQVTHLVCFPYWAILAPGKPPPSSSREESTGRIGSRLKVPQASRINSTSMLAMRVILYFLAATFF